MLKNNKVHNEIYKLDIFVQSMCSVGEHSPLSLNLEQRVLKKISELVADLHARLLARTSGSGVYRDLSNDQEYLLATLDDDHVLHSVLAGCLAVDSCVINLLDGDKTVTHNILEILSSSSTTLQHLQKELLPYQKHAINELMNTLGENLSSLMNEIHINGPFFETKQESPAKQNFHTISELKNENSALKQQLSNMQKKKLQLEIQLFKLTDKTDEHHNRRPLPKHWQSQKNELMHEISKLEEQIRILSKYNDIDVYYLLEELQYEVEKLRQQKLNDQNIITDIQLKLDKLSTTKHTKFRNLDSMHTEYPAHSRLTPPRTFDNFAQLPTRKSSTIIKTPFKQTDKRKSKEKGGGKKYDKYRAEPLHRQYNDGFGPEKSPRKPNPLSYSSTELSTLARLQPPFP